MRFLVGFVAAFVIGIVVAFFVIISGAYNVAATVPHTKLEHIIFNSTMAYSVRAHAKEEAPESWSQDEIKSGFKNYNEMCVICHGAPGKALSYLGKGLQPQPPNLAEAVEKWTNGQLFWIIKNGVKMTGMPAFGPTHDDVDIWSIVGFIRRLPRTSAQEFQSMAQELGRSAEPHQPHDHP